MPSRSAFHTSTPFRFVPPELAVVSGADTALAVELELLDLRNAGRDCGLNIYTSLTGLLHQAAVWMGYSARLSLTEAQGAGLSGALEEFVTSTNSNAPANFVEELGSRLGVDGRRDYGNSEVIE